MDRTMKTSSGIPIVCFSNGSDGGLTPKPDAARYGTVMTTGCFDILHAGHLSVLDTAVQTAREIGGLLVIGVDVDDVVAKKGPGRPVVPFETRVELVDRITRHYPHRVIGYSHDVFSKADIYSINPDYFIKGADYVGKDLPVPTSTRIVLAPMVETSTTGILNRYLMRIGGAGE